MFHTETPRATVAQALLPVSAAHYNLLATKLRKSPHTA